MNRDAHAMEHRATQPLGGLPRTPHLVLGPFYPVAAIGDAGAELWHAATRTAQHVQPVEVSGQILNTAGAPVVGALVEAWQADHEGRYRHPSAPVPAPDDEGFRGHASLRTDHQGRYRLRTLKPGAYRLGRGMRAPHVHFQITGRHDRLVTQMFFPNEPMNADDHLLLAASRPQLLMASILDDGLAGLRFGWDIVLARG